MIRVGFLTEKDPFSFIIDQKPTGIAFDIWHNFNQPYQIVAQRSDPEVLIELLKTNQVDVLVGCFSMSHNRLSQFHFSKPFYISKLRLYQHKSSTSWIRIFLIVLILVLIGFYLISLYNKKPFVDTFFESIEHFMNKENVLRNNAGGIAFGINFLFKVMSFLFTIFVVSVITYTVEVYRNKNVLDVKKFKGKRIGHIESEAFARIIHQKNMVSVEYPSLDELKLAFETNQVDAILEDEFVFKENFDKNEIHSDVLLLDDYGFLFQSHELCKQFNLYLFHLQETENSKSICSKYLDEKDVVYCQI